MQLSPMVFGAIGIGILVVISAIIIMVLLLRPQIAKAHKNMIVKAFIDLYPTGGHHVELIPADGTHPMDLVQLAVSYFANMLVVTTNDPKELLFRFVKLWSGNSSGEFRQKLEDFVNNPEPSLVSTGVYTTKSGERFETILTRGRQLDYTITKFSMIGYRPNCIRTIAMLTNAVVAKLDSAHIELLHNSMSEVYALEIVGDLTTANNQIMAFGAVELVLKRMADDGHILARSPGRPNVQIELPKPPSAIVLP